MGEESRGLGIFAGKAQRSWSEATKKSGTILSLCMAESQGIPKTYQAAEGHFWGMDTIQLSAAMAQSNATLPGAILNNLHDVLHQLVPDLAMHISHSYTLDHEVSRPCGQDVVTAAIAGEDEAGFEGDGSIFKIRKSLRWPC